MATDPSLNGLLTRVVQNLTERPDNEPLRKLLERNKLKAVDLRVIVTDREDTGRDKLSASDRRSKAETPELERWADLMSLYSLYPWQDFVSAVSRKIDITGRWKTTIAKRIGISLSDLQYAESIARAKPEWLTRIADMPDMPPPSERSNFQKVGCPLVRALRKGGMTNADIARTLSQFLADFNGNKVSVADVTFTR